MSINLERTPNFLGALLIEKNLISTGQLERALAEQRVVNKRLGEVLLGTKVISRQQLQEVLSEQQALRTNDPSQVKQAQSSIKEIVEQVFSTRTISTIEQELLMSILLSENTLGFDEQRLIEDLFAKVQSGWIRVI
jgi:hypothetical protein